MKQGSEKCETFKNFRPSYFIIEKDDRAFKESRELFFIYIMKKN